MARPGVAAPLQQLNWMAVAAMAVLSAAVLVIAARPPHARVAAPSPGTVVEDLRQRRVRLDVPARRVMFDQPMVWHYMTVDETDAHVATLYPYLWREARNELLTRLFPGFARRTPLIIRAETNMLSIEQVLIEEPDAVITGEWFGSLLETTGYPAVIELDDRDEPDRASLFRLIGAMTGKPGRAEALLTRYRHAIARVGAGVPPGTKPVDVVIVSSEQLYVVSGRQASLDALLRTAGARNAVEQARPFNGAANVEELYRLDPQAILLLSSPYHSLAPQTLYENPALRALDAVQQRRVYRMPTGASRMAGPVEAPLLVSWMARLLHPGGRWRTSLRGEITDAYREVYGHAFTTRDFDTMLHPRDNAGAAGFERLLDGAPIQTSETKGEDRGTALAY
ncbi:MAG: ABC transporter substrate-binding protein [Comamonadaceae bacterium]|nr:ABC transporter substrate-binding protein [Comamonadaceae bacterium]OJX29740.1 MAG: hypothetical protein BGO75_13660 [Burkholderiales bacterium 68-20]